MRLGLLALLAGCYTQADAAHDLHPSWRGHAAAELSVELGAPRAQVAQPDGTTVLRWTHTGTNLASLPSGRFDLSVTPTSVDFHAEASPGVVERVEYEIASAVVDPRGTVLRFDSALLVVPPGHRARTGLIMGLHGGMGGLDDATQALPGGGAYIGGMLSPRLALVGAYLFVNGKDAGADAFVQGHAWSLAAQYWATSRLALRAGPAMVLHTDPIELAPGALGGLSFAAVRSGSFVLDVRADATASTKGTFGMLGVGVNLN